MCSAHPEEGRANDRACALGVSHKIFTCGGRCGRIDLLRKRGRSVVGMGWYAKQKARYEAKKAEPHESWGEMRARVKAEQVAKEPRQKAEPAKEDQTAKTVCPPV